MGQVRVRLGFRGAGCIEVWHQLWSAAMTTTTLLSCVTSAQKNTPVITWYRKMALRIGDSDERVLGTLPPKSGANAPGLAVHAAKTSKTAPTRPIEMKLRYLESSAKICTTVKPGRPYAFSVLGNRADGTHQLNEPA